MKHFLLLAFVAILVSSCGKDNCSTETFVGTWTGSKTCTLVTGTSNVSIVATQSGDNILLNGDVFSDESMKRDDCSLEGGTTFLGIGTEVSATVSEDGKSLTINYVVKSGVADETCTYTLTK